MIAVPLPVASLVVAEPVGPADMTSVTCGLIECEITRSAIGAGTP